VRRHLRCSRGGSASTNEIPPLGTLLHLSNEETNGVSLILSGSLQGLGFGESLQTGSLVEPIQSEDPTVVRTAQTALPSGFVGVLFRDICQMGSLAGAAYLLHDNAGVPRRAQWEQKSHVAHKRKSSLD